MPNGTDILFSFPRFCFSLSGIDGKNLFQIRVYKDPNNGRIKLATTGTTAEVMELKSSAFVDS